MCEERTESREPENIYPPSSAPSCSEPLEAEKNKIIVKIFVIVI